MLESGDLVSNVVADIDEVARTLVRLLLASKGFLHHELFLHFCSQVVVQTPPLLLHSVKHI